MNSKLNWIELSHLNSSWQKSHKTGKPCLTYFSACIGLLCACTLEISAGKVCDIGSMLYVQEQSARKKNTTKRNRK